MAMGCLLVMTMFFSQYSLKTSAATTSTQLIPNSGFETGTLSPWTTQNNATVVSNDAHSGSYAVNLGGPSSGVQTTITNLNPNTSYTLKAWVKTAGDPIYLGAKNFAGSGTQVNTVTTSSAYTQLTVSFTTGSASTSAYIFLWKGNNTGTAYADDITLQKSPPKYSDQKYNGQDIGFNTQDPYFLDQSSLNKLYNQVAKTGAKWVRVTLFWDLMEPTKGKINWKQADMIFHAIKAHGLKYEMVIRSAPSWAANGADTSLHNYAPTDSISYGKFCYQVAKRYLNHGVPVVFELGNEENMQFFNEPKVDPAQYTKNMLIPGSKGIHLAAKQLGVSVPTILVGGFAPVSPQYVPNSMTPLNFMKAIYANGGKGYFNSIAYHPYTYVTAPSTSNSTGEFTFSQLQSIVDLMNSKGDTNMKVWATEVGWATGSGGGEISEAKQAEFTGEEFDKWFSLPYAGPMIWYELVDNSSYDNSNRENTFGLLHSDATWSPKPAYNVFLSKVAKVDTHVLNAEIAISERMIHLASESHHSQEAVKQLKAAISKAKRVESNPLSNQESVNAEVKNLRGAVKTFIFEVVQKGDGHHRHHSRRHNG